VLKVIVSRFVTLTWLSYTSYIALKARREVRTAVLWWLHWRTVKSQRSISHLPKVSVRFFARMKWNFLLSARLSEISSDGWLGIVIGSAGWIATSTGVEVLDFFLCDITYSHVRPVVWHFLQRGFVSSLVGKIYSVLLYLNNIN